MRLTGYLLDTNHLEAYFDEDSKFMAQVKNLAPEEQIHFWTSAIVLGEVEASFRMTSRSAKTAVDFQRFISGKFLFGPEPRGILPVDHHTRDYYAEIVGRIWTRHPPQSHRTRTEMHLVQLGVDVNDIWICATAWKHGLTLLTQDTMRCIRGVVSQREMNVECWI